MVRAQCWVKCRDFSGIPKRGDFKLVEEELPALKDGGKTFYAVADPGRGVCPLAPSL